MDIHYTDVILTVIFGGIGAFAGWSGRMLLNHDKALSLIDFKISSIYLRMFPRGSDETDVNKHDHVVLRNGRKPVLHTRRVP